MIKYTRADVKNAVRTFAATALVCSGLAVASAAISPVSAAVTGCDGIVWTGVGPETTDVWTADDHGANRDNITDLHKEPAPTTNFSPEWSPDGTQIAWYGFNGTTNQIWTANADGTQRQEISPVSTGTDPTANTSPQWRPRASNVALTSTASAPLRVLRRRSRSPLLPPVRIPT